MRATIPALVAILLPACFDPVPFSVKVHCASDEDCPPRHSCVQQLCVACPACSADERCVAAQCRPDPCAGKLCAPGAVCVDGRCVDAKCAAVSCAAGTRCADGACVACTATETSCGDDVDEDCDGKTDCADEDCAGRQCAAGRICNAQACVAGCWIDSMYYADGAVNPANACQSCQPSASGTAWTDAPDGTSCGNGKVCNSVVCQDGCSIASTYYASGAVNTANACQSCQPLVSSTAWTDAPDGTSCGNGSFCESGICQVGCLIASIYYPDGAVNTANACQSCQPLVSSTAWTDAPNGTSCGNGKVCNSVVCQDGCWIALKYYASSAVNIANACQSCQPSASGTAWTDAPDGTSCGNGKVCNSVVCQDGCWIASKYFAGGTANPANACQTCQPLVSTSLFSAVVDDTSCGAGMVCRSGNCVSAPGGHQPPGYALLFDGVDDWVEVPDSASLDLVNAISIELWLKPDVVTAAPDWRNVIGKMAASGEAYGFLVTEDQTQIYFYIGSGGVSWVGPLPIVPGQWQHVVGGYDRSLSPDNIFIYVNGAGGGGPIAANPITVTALPLYLGGYPGGGPYAPYKFSGAMDEIRVYSRLLGATEAQEHYQAIFTNESGLVALWHCDEGTGTSLGDSSPNGNTGTLTNGPQWLAVP